MVLPFVNKTTVKILKTGTERLKEGCFQNGIVIALRQKKARRACAEVEESLKKGNCLSGVGDFTVGTLTPIGNLIIKKEVLS